MPASLDDTFFYQHSGRSGLSVPLILLLGLPAAALLAVIYAYIVVYCPIVGYVNVLFLGGYIVATGWVISKLAKIGKARNGMVLFVLGALAGLVGLYFSWIFFFVALHELHPVAIVEMIIRPGAFWKEIVTVNNEGWWGPSGIAQWALCAIEAVAFVFGVGLMAYVSIDREVFCEDCGKWCETTHTRHLQLTEEFSKALAKALADSEEPQFDHLEVLKLPEAPDGEVPRFEAEILKCSQCETSAVRLQLLVAKAGSDGEVEIETTELSGILLQPAKQPSKQPA